MERKNTLLLTVIAIATLLVAVIGATFAYFASTTEIEATANVTATTGAAASFSSSSTDALELNITAALMTEASAETEPEAANDSANLIVNLSAAANVECTYNIGYVNTATEGNEYTPVEPTTDSRSYEFEITASYCQEEDCTLETATWTPYNLNGENAEIGYAALLTTDTQPEEGEAYKAVVKNATIAVPEGATTAIPVTWKFTGRFYNLNAEQATEKVYSGYFKVMEAKC